MADTRIEELRRRLEREPGSRLFAQLAEELRKSGELDEAVRVARAGLAVHPGYSSARLTLGRALLDSGDAQAARRELESVVREAPDNIQASRYLALARDQLGDLAGAAEQYRKTLLMAPGDRQLQAALAELETRRGAAGGPSGAGAQTTPPAPRGVPPPLPPDAGVGGPAAARASAPPLVFAPSRPERPAQLESEDRVEGGGLAPTLRIHASQPATLPPAAPQTGTPEPASAPTPPPPPAPPPPPPPLAAPAQARPAEAPEATSGPEPGTLPGGRPDAGGQLAETARPSSGVPDASAPFPSSTLAELYFQQGLVARAADVYRQLLEQEPGNQKARQRLVEIEGAPTEAADRGARRRALERTIAGLESLLVAVRRR